MATWSGIALHLVISGCVGLVYSLLFGGLRSRARLILLGALAGIVWFYLADAILWGNLNRWVSLYSPQPSTLLAHAVFGACAGWRVSRWRPAEAPRIAESNPMPGSAEPMAPEPSGDPAPPEAGDGPDKVE